MKFCTKWTDHDLTASNIYLLPWKRKQCFPSRTPPLSYTLLCSGQLKCDGTRAETRFGLSAKRTSPFKSAGASVQPTTGSRGVRISGSNAGDTMFRGSVKSTGCPLHSPVSPSVFLPCFSVCNHISTGLYLSCLTIAYARRPSSIQEQDKKQGWPSINMKPRNTNQNRALSHTYPAAVP